MFTKLFLLSAFAGVFGALVHNLFKIKSLKAIADSNRTTFTLADFWKKDWPTILLSFCSAPALQLIFPELAASYAWATNWQISLHFGAGLIGSYGLHQAMGQSTAFLNSKTKAITAELEGLKKQINETADTPAIG